MLGVRAWTSSLRRRAAAFLHPQGVATIRGFNSVDAFIAHNRLCVDFAHRPLYAGQCTRRWMDLRLELVNALSITSVAGAAIFMAHVLSAALEPGLAGIALKSIITNQKFLGTCGDVDVRTFLASSFPAPPPLPKRKMAAVFSVEAVVKSRVGWCRLVAEGSLWTPHTSRGAEAASPVHPQAPP